MLRHTPWNVTSVAALQIKTISNIYRYTLVGILECWNTLKPHRLPRKVCLEAQRRNLRGKFCENALLAVVSAAVQLK